MSDAIHELYSSRLYPAMSHPLSDPAVSAAAAVMAGLRVPQPSTASILEIGCGSGHNLIPLAMRWPQGRFIGIDLSECAIDLAQDLAAASGADNITFHTADLRDFESSNNKWDYIIAHGFFSWVPDEVKTALFAFCHRNLTPAGIATISFNLECGWLLRFPVIEKARAIQRAGAPDTLAALAILRTVTAPDSPELAIIDDMLAKGPDILPFDDFAPINDPWPLDQFIRTAAAIGLCCLGESDPGLNLPQQLDPSVCENLRRHATDPLAFQMAADAAAQRTFRSLVLCRTDAPLEPLSPTQQVSIFSVRSNPESPIPDHAETLRRLLPETHACIPTNELLDTPPHDPDDAARRILEGIRERWILPRIEPLHFAPEAPDFPRLNPFRLECARRGLPLVDVWHRPCAFPARHYQILATMDGSRSRSALAAFAARHSPELAFAPWLRHLAGRGMFA